MKTVKYYTTILILASVLLSGLVFGIDNTVPDERTLRKSLVSSTLNFDGNRIRNYLENSGFSLI